MSDEQDAGIACKSVSDVKFPTMQKASVRLKTFRNFDFYFSQSTMDLVRAGFFYAGNNDDTVICFSCGVKLNNWEATDIPHVEHSRFSPECKHVMHRKYNAHVNEIIAQLLKLKIRLE